MKVDINSLESAIKATKKCLDDYEKEFDSITNLVNNIAFCWEGGDYEQFTNYWNKNFVAQKSPESAFNKELNEYYNFLKAAKKMYEEMKRNLNAHSHQL